ncbi:hypothetical protein HYV30_02195 [Candidatus Kaiserbacteria bacterium]|nr:hypothetical protein [Candidatus Kaiserbacteria bacterium]
MAKVSTTIRSTKGRKLVLEIDADRLERLAATFGLFNPAFLESVARAEADYRAGRTHRMSPSGKVRFA